MARDVVSLLGTCYTFVVRSYRRRQPLWPSVLKELRWIHSLLPLALCKMDRAWSGTVYHYDACLTGIGVCYSRWSPEVAASHGRIRERQRFRGTPLGTVLDDDDAAASPPIRLSDTQVLEFGASVNFPEIASCDLTAAP